MTYQQPTLTGLEQPLPSSSRLEQAAHQTLQKLQDEGLLGDEHALMVQLVRDLAAVVGDSCHRGRAAAAALAAKQLTEALDALPKPTSTGGLAGLVSELRAV